MSLDFIRKLPIPKELKEQYPLNNAIVEIKLQRDTEIKNVLTGDSNKFLIIVGPCSADCEESILDYVMRLAKLQERVKEKIIIVPRVYTNKPRTRGNGYKGMLHQPVSSEKEDMLKGIIAVRRLHKKIIDCSGLTAADEMLYPDIFRYISDLVSYISVGARSVENQEHRMVASGLDIPVGMKNPTSGNVDVMLNSIVAAQLKHRFIYRGWEVDSSGNPFAHAILRGYINKSGQNLPNYHYEELLEVYEKYHLEKVKNRALIVDVNHSNSKKNYSEQIRISKDIVRSRKLSNCIKQLVKGIMLESYIEDGNQDIAGTTYGLSVTDSCLGWTKTESLIYDLADML